MNNTDFYLQVIHTLVHTLTYTQHSQKYNGSNTHATDICTRTHIHTHRQQIIIIYTSMATDIIQELLPLKMNWLKGKMKRQIKLLSYRFCNFVLSPQEIIVILKEKKLITFYLHFSALIFYLAPELFMYILSLITP